VPLRASHTQPPALTAAYAATVRALIAVINALNEAANALRDVRGL
jgi:hypothetical protein